MSSKQDDPTKNYMETMINDLRETIKLLQSSLKEKDEAIITMTKELSEMRKQLTQVLVQAPSLHDEEKPSDSSSEDEGTTTEEKMDDDSSSVISTETLASASEEDAEFKTIKNRKTRRAERFSSDEESSVRKETVTPTTEGTPSKKTKKARKQTSKSNFNSDINDFPPLPSQEPAAGTSAATPADPPTAPLPPTKPTTPQIVKRIPRPKAIPPIVISNAGKFISISNLFRTNNVHYTSAVVVRNGIKIFPATEPDYRKATALLEQNKEPFFTFRFPEEKLNHVVLRGAPTHLTKDQIADDLIKQGFSPKRIIRWTHSDGTPMPLVLVLLPKSETDIYKVKVIITFDVRVEARRSRPRGIQCYNCQDHGHAAPCCHIPAKCVKCGESHHTSQCTKSRDVPAKCANCAGDHPASFSGCPRHPSQIKPKKSNFKGWGTQDNSSLAPRNTHKQPPQQTPATLPNVASLPPAQLAQITQLIAATIQDQLKTLMTSLTDKRT